MHSEDIALVFFDSLERAENALLAWGVVDSFFAEEELVERAETFLEALPLSERVYDTGSDLLSDLLAAHLTLAAHFTVSEKEAGCSRPRQHPEISLAEIAIV